MDDSNGIRSFREGRLSRALIRRLFRTRRYFIRRALIYSVRFFGPPPTRLAGLQPSLQPSNYKPAYNYTKWAWRMFITPCSVDQCSVSRRNARSSRESFFFFLTPRNLHGSLDRAERSSLRRQRRMSCKSINNEVRKALTK